MIYIIVFFFFMIFMLLAEKSSIHKNFFYWLTCFGLIVFNSIRYDVGNDYLSYKHFFKSINTSSIYSIEPFFYFIASLFKESLNGYLWVFAFTTSITYFFLFLALRNYKKRTLICLMIFSLEFLFFSNNQIAQAASFSLLLFLPYYYRKRNFLGYFFIIICSMFFHFSSIVFLPFFFFNYKKINTSILLIISLMSVLLQKKMLISIFSLIEYVPYYNKLYLGRAKFFNFFLDNSGTNILVYFRFIISVIVILIYRNNKIKPNYPLVLFVIGVFLMNISGGFMPLERLGYSFYYFILIAIPLSFVSQSKLNMTYFLNAFLIFWFLIIVITEKNKHGAFPYKTIFNKEYRY